MDVLFRTRKLERQYQDVQQASKAYGEEVARRYIGRINIIKQAHDVEELQRLPGLRCHPLKGNLKGLWAINLTGFYRLIFTMHGERLDVVRIEEVSKHYDD